MDYLTQIEAYMTIAWRRKWFVVVPAVLGVVAGALQLRRMDLVYVTKAVVTEEREGPQLGRGRAGFDTAKTMQNRLQKIDFAVPVTRKVRNLAQDAVPDEMAVERVRKIFSLEFDGDLIYFKGTGRHPAEIARVANAYAEQFVEAVRSKKLSRTGQYATFYDKELEEKRRELEAAQGRVATFRDTHRGVLPDDIDSLTASTQRKADELTQARAELQTAKEALDSFVSMLESSATMVALEPGAPAPVASDPAARLGQLEKELADLQRHLTEKHPDVQAKKRDIEALKAQIAASPPSGGPEPDEAATRGTASGEDHLEATRIGMVNYNQLRTMRTDVRRLETKVALLQGEIARTEARLTSANRSSVEYLALTRERDILQAEHRDLQNQAQKATMAQDIATSLQADTFQILERAPIPETPISPKPLMILMAGLAVGAALGVGIVFLLEFLDQTYKTAADVATDLGVPVIATITRIEQVRGTTKKDLSMRKAG